MTEKIELKRLLEEKHFSG